MYYWSRSAAPSRLDFPFSLLERTRWASCQVSILSPQEAAKDVLGRMKMVEVEVRFEVATFFFAVWDVPPWVSPDGLTSRLFCLPLSSWSPWKGNEPAERGEWGSRVPAEKAVKSSLSSECCRASSSSLSMVRAKCMKLSSAYQF